MKRVVALVLAVAVLATLALSGSAVAATPAKGKWAGKVIERDAKVRFRVTKDRKKVKGFTIPAIVVVCGLDIRTYTIAVPTAKIRKNGRFSGTQLYGSDGEVTAVHAVSGVFTKKKRAVGRVAFSINGCEKDFTFRARLK